MKNKILFICKNRVDNYGNSFGLINSARFVSHFLNSVNIDSEVISVIDSNKIDKEVTLRNPSHVFIEALFVSPEKIKEILSIPRHKKRKWIIRIHSRIPFLANEGIAIKWIAEYSNIQKEFDNLYLAPNGFEETRDFMNIFKGKWVHLPNVYSVPDCDFDIVQDKNPAILDVGCFGAIRPMKNSLIQAFAAIEYADRAKKKLRFHINSNRLEQNGDQVLKNIQELFKGLDQKHFELIEHPWLMYKDFINLVRTMDIGMQVSFSESFNIVAADFVSNNIPIIVSPEVKWMNFIYKADPNSSDNIVDTLSIAMFLKKFNIHYVNKVNLYMHNRYSETLWLNFLAISPTI